MATRSKPTETGAKPARTDDAAKAGKPAKAVKTSKTDKAAAAAKKQPKARAAKPAAPEPKADEGRLLVFLRHGIAEERTDGTPDAERELTDKGNSRMKSISRGLHEVLGEVDAIFTSPLIRAVQTTLWLSRRFASGTIVETTDVLLPEAEPRAVIALAESSQHRRMIFVGHEPHLSRTVAALTGGAAVELRKGGACAIRINPDGRKSLEWVLTPRLLRALSAK